MKRLEVKTPLTNRTCSIDRDSIPMSIRKTSCKRMSIHPKDIEVLTGIGLRASQKMLNRIKRQLGKEKHQLLTITEFCTFVGFDETLVRETIL